MALRMCRWQCFWLTEWEEKNRHQRCNNITPGCWTYFLIAWLTVALLYCVKFKSWVKKKGSILNRIFPDLVRFVRQQEKSAVFSRFSSRHLLWGGQLMARERFRVILKNLWKREILWCDDGVFFILEKGFCCNEINGFWSMFTRKF